MKIVSQVFIIWESVIEIFLNSNKRFNILRRLCNGQVKTEKPNLNVLRMVS
jgi:hypothetical protein